MNNIKEPIRLREKELSNGVKSLYLDIYINGKRKYEFLKLYINPGNDRITKAQNKVTIEAAKVILARRLVSLKCKKADIYNDSNDINFVEGYRKYYSTKKIAEKTVNISNHAIDYWVRCFGDKIKINEITEDIIKKFIEYLRNITPTTRNKTHKIYNDKYVSTEEIESIVYDMKSSGMRDCEIGRSLCLCGADVQLIYKRALNRKESKRYYLSESSVCRYFVMINTYLNHLDRIGLIRNPSKKLTKNELPGNDNRERDYLTLEEVMTLINTECYIPVIKNAFLFACFTGLRKSDILSLKWSDIKNNEIVKKMKKTGKYVTIPLSYNAILFLPKKNNNDYIFNGFPSDQTVSYALKKWTDLANINKTVTFHVSRHTFATMALTYGADLYTVSNLLGHTNIQTTQIYAKIVDKKKKDAVNMIPRMCEITKNQK